MAEKSQNTEKGRRKNPQIWFCASLYKKFKMYLNNM